MNGRYQQQHRGHGGHGRRDQGARIDTSRIRFSDIDPELFNQIASDSATVVSDCKGHLNKATQLRKFYDELCMWDAKVNLDEERFTEYRPFILMMNAKVAYAEGRKLVDNNYMTLLSHCLNSATSAREFRNCKLFMEAFMGFYKSVRPR